MKKIKITNALDNKRFFLAVLSRHMEKCYPQCRRTCGHWHIYLVLEVDQNLSESFIELFCNKSYQEIWLRQNVIFSNPYHLYLQCSVRACSRQGLRLNPPASHVLAFGNALNDCSEAAQVLLLQVGALDTSCAFELML